MLDEELELVEGSVVRVTRRFPPVFDGDLLASETTTDAEGRWAIEAPPLGSIRISASHAVHGEGSRELSVGVGESHEVDLGLSSGLRVFGTVVDEYGAPLAGWRIELERIGVHDGWRGEATTDGAGQFHAFHCAPVEHTLSVFEPSGVLPVLVLDSAVPSDEALQIVVPAELRASGEIRFALVDPEGLPETGVTALVMSAQSAGGDRAHVTVEESGQPGHFRAGPLPPGVHDLRVWPGRYAFLERVGIGVGPGERVDLGVLQLSRGGRVLVTFDATAVFGQTPRMWLAGPSAIWTGQLEETTSGWRSQPLVAGSYRVEVTGHRLAQQSVPVEVREGEQTSVQLVLTPGLPHVFTIHGLHDLERAGEAPPTGVGNRDGFGLEVSDLDGARVAWIPHDLQTALSQGESSQAVAQLAPGRYRVQLLVDGASAAEALFDVAAGTTTPGMTRLDVR